MGVDPGRKGRARGTKLVWDGSSNGENSGALNIIGYRAKNVRAAVRRRTQICCDNCPVGKICIPRKIPLVSPYSITQTDDQIIGNLESLLNISENNNKNNNSENTNLSYKDNINKCDPSAEINMYQTLDFEEHYANSIFYSENPIKLLGLPNILYINLLQNSNFDSFTPIKLLKKKTYKK